MDETKTPNDPTWRVVLRIVLKAALIVLVLNLLFAWLYPLEALGRLSLYNVLLPGRERPPYGENPAQSYSLSLNNVPAMLASHRLDTRKAPDEFRVLIIGDSGTWGWFLENDATLAGQINALGLTTADSRRVVAYNVGYPVMSLTKDLLLLDAALATGPDLVIWPVTLESFPPEKQLVAQLVKHNPQRVRPLIAQYDLAIDPADPEFVEPTFLQRTLFGQRRPLADLLRLQTYGFAWGATGIDQAIPAEIPLRQSDFEPDESWQSYTGPATLTTADLAFDVLAAGMAHPDPVPVLLINEPIFISSGENSDLRYNVWYPRWAYDQYRALLAETAVANAWRFVDLWDAIPPDEFTDSPVHLTPAGTALEAQRLAPLIIDIANEA